MPSPGLSGEKAFEPAEGAVVEVDEDAVDETPTTMTTGVTGGDTRFQVFARLANIDTHVGITLKADLDDTNPEVDSWVELFRGADWHERETWEMYGFNFVGHPGLRHLYLPSEFEGFPLRKDFPLLAREVKPWPGLVDVEPIPGDGDEGEPAEGAEGEEAE
jgi:NADH-quinone oxidoreductase subunit C